MRKAFRKVILGAALAALCVAPAAATTIQFAVVDANCESYTITISGFAFEPEGETVDVEYRITLDALTPGNDPVVVNGLETLDSTGCTPADGRATCDIELTKTYTWTEALGYALPCGDYMLNTSSDGSCEGKPSRYIWTSPATNETFCEVLDPVDSWDGYLACPCDEPGTEICRTPGFWGTHGGREKCRSQNITMQVLDAALMPVEVCGEPVDTTRIGRPGSALEAMCVSPRGDSRLQLVRQLTAAALNCVMTNGNGDCFGVSIESDFAACNEACIYEDEHAYGACIDAIDCFNNGGVLLDNGTCQTGTCADTGDACDSDEACGLDDHGRAIECLPLEGNCHDRPLVNADLGLEFDPPGPAGSPRACRSAKRNDCTLFSCEEKSCGGKHGKGGKRDRGGKHGKGGKDGKHGDDDRDDDRDDDDRDDDDHDDD